MDFYGFVPSAHLGFPTHDLLAARGLVLFRAAVQQPSPEGLIQKPHQIMERDPNPQKCLPSWTLCVSGHEKEAPEPRQL